MILDACNVMGSIFKGVEEELGLKLTWLSWLVDLAGPAAAKTPANGVAGSTVTA